MLQTAPSFWSINLGEIIAGLPVFIMALALFFDRRKDRKVDHSDHEKSIVEQTRMHEENTQKLRSLIAFSEEQVEVNQRRDRQIGELTTQTTRLGEIAIATNRRLEMLEDRSSGRHN